MSIEILTQRFEYKWSIQVSKFEYRVVEEDIIIENEDGTDTEATVYHFAEIELDDEGLAVDHYLLCDDDLALMKDSKEGLKYELQLLMEALDQPAIKIHAVD